MEVYRYRVDYVHCSLRLLFPESANGGSEGRGTGMGYRYTHIQKVQDIYSARAIYHTLFIYQHSYVGGCISIGESRESIYVHMQIVQIHHIIQDVQAYLLRIQRLLATQPCILYIQVATGVHGLDSHRGCIYRPVLAESILPRIAIRSIGGSRSSSIYMCTLYSVYRIQGVPYRLYVYRCYLEQMYILGYLLC